MSMKTGYWIIIAAVIWCIAVFAGYRVSSATGVQVGYFEAAEAGGYGAPSDTVEGIDKQTQDYYKDLYK
jgi:hypothetical protein